MPDPHPPDLEGESSHPEGPPEPPPGSSARADAIRAVSDLLSRKKPFGGPPAPARLPAFPRSLEATILSLRKAPGLRTKFDPPAALVGPPPVERPEVGPPDRPGEGGPPPEGGPTTVPAGPAAPRPPDGVGVPTAGGGGGPPGPVAPGPIEAGPGGGVGAVDRLAPPSTALPDGLGPSRPPGDPGGFVPDAEGPDDRVAPPSPAPVGLAGPPAGPAETPEFRTSAIGRPRDLLPTPADAARPAAWAEAARVGGPPSGPVEAAGWPSPGPSITVRAPLPPGLRGVSPATPDSSGGDGPAPGPDPSGLGPGPGGPAFGRSAPPQGGGAADLSKTNELLRQLIDAVKRQRDSSLPVGGPSVYPGR